MTTGTGRIYVGSLEMSNNPIGRENTKIEMCGSAISNEGFGQSGLDSMLMGLIFMTFL